MGVASRSAKAARRRGPARQSARATKLDALAAELRQAARSLGIRVRQEHLLREVGYHARSGLCRLEGEEILLLDATLPSEQQVELLLDAIGQRDLGEVSLSEGARRLVDRARQPAA